MVKTCHSVPVETEAPMPLSGGMNSKRPGRQRGFFPHFDPKEFYRPKCAANNGHVMLLKMGSKIHAEIGSLGTVHYV